jgi:hypothetical protein
LDEFVEYYTNVSASIDNEEYFALMMNNSWNLSGDAPTYKQNQKAAWANQPATDRNNAFAGVPHTGYQQGKDSVKMVQQRMGMVSESNPLSHTTRYYTNQYDSRR